MKLHNTVLFISRDMASATVIANNIDTAATILTFWTTGSDAVTSNWLAMMLSHLSSRLYKKYISLVLWSISDHQKETNYNPWIGYVTSSQMENKANTFTPCLPPLLFNFSILYPPPTRHNNNIRHGSSNSIWNSESKQPPLYTACPGPYS